MQGPAWVIDASHLERAAEAVAAHAAHTPLRRCEELGEGAWLKLETEQRTGSFKVRGALAALAALDDEARRGGVITASAGNHGYGLAYAGRALGVGVTVFCAASTPAVKRDGIAAAGATLELVDAPGYDAVEARAKAAAAERGVRFVSPFDDPLVAAGNGGTLAREILEDLPDVKTVVVPVGGGGLMSGVAAARRLGSADFALHGVQSEACPAMVRSLADGRAHLAFEGERTLAEGLEGGVSWTTYHVARTELAAMALVSEAELAEAMAWAKRGLGLSIEGSAAVGLAYARRERLRSPFVVVISGGNVDPAKLEKVLHEHS